MASAVRRWLEVERVILLHTERIAERTVLIGMVLEAGTDKPIREGAIAIGSVPQAGTDALAEFLINGTVSPRVLTGTALRPLPSPRPSGKSPQEYLNREPWYRDKLGWALLATGLVTAGVGGGFLWNASAIETDADRTVDEFARRSQLERADDRRLVGFVLLPTGAAIAVVGAIKLAIPSPHRTHPERVSLVNSVNFVDLAGAL